MLRYVAFAAAVALPAAAHANSTASAGTRISLVVPEVCRIEAPVIAVDRESGTAAGNVFEMCNSGRGFRVIASHRALDAGETARIAYAGQTRQLAASGQSDIALRHGPAARYVPIAIETQGLRQDLAISLGFAAI